MKLQGKKVAILATDGFEQSELFSPMDALKNEGAQVDIVSIKSGSIKGWDKDDWGKSIEVDKKIEQASASDYNALMLPGGVMNPDSLRKDENALNFVRSFFKEGKPVAAICHAPQILISADVVENRNMTSYDSIKKDLQNAGVNWTDEEVVVDAGLVTSRNPDDLPAFNKKLIEEVGEGVHEEQVANA
jgi:protease I